MLVIIGIIYHNTININNTDIKTCLKGTGKDGYELQKKINVLVLKQICLFYEETPSHGPIPPIVRMARWPKTAG